MDIIILIYILSYIQRHIYGQQGKNIHIFADDSSLSVNPSYIRSWIQFLSTTPRVAPFLSKKNPLIVALKRVRPDYTLLLCHSSFEAKTLANAFPKS